MQELFLDEALQNAEASARSDDKLVLPYDQRQKSRFVAKLASGQAVLVRLPRGTLLRGGARLRAENGLTVVVRAAPEALSVVVCSDPLRLSTIAYHLGNRHVPLQIRLGELCYEHDHVLDQMVERLGGKPVCEQRPFEPESGAYGSAAIGSHSHGRHPRAGTQ